MSGHTGCDSSHNLVLPFTTQGHNSSCFVGIGRLMWNYYCDRVNLTSVIEQCIFTICMTKDLKRSTIF